MRIFYYYHAAMNIPSGSARHIIEVMEELQKRGHDISLFALDRGRYQFETLFKIVYMPSLNIKPRIIGYYLECVLVVLYMIYCGLKAKPDILYVRTPFYAFHPIFIAWLLRCHHIAEIMELQLEDLKWAGASRLRLALTRLCETLNYRFADRIIAITDEVRTMLSRVYRIPLNKIIHIEAGANPEKCRPIETRKARVEMGLPVDDLYVGFIGSFYLWSGIGDLISIAPTILREVPQSRFIIIGSGELDKEFRDKVDLLGVKDRFVFTGQITFDKIPLYINAFDIGVAPYILGGDISRKTSASSIKVFEYMSCAKPVVTTDIKGTGDIVRESECGIVVPLYQPDKLAAAIIR
ncbi:MAG: glycosyltransferase family 4 protein, partial [Planctomycetota bacterium]